jgi:hypothetical protein
MAVLAAGADLGSSRDKPSMSSIQTALSDYDAKRALAAVEAIAQHLWPRGCVDVAGTGDLIACKQLPTRRSERG